VKLIGLKDGHRGRKEAFLRIPMPWTSYSYCINNDDFGMHRPHFAIFVEKISSWPRWAWNIRIGMAAVCVGPHECMDDVQMTKPDGTRI
jgi:hypothetical protein